MMHLDASGGRIFAFHAPQAEVVELTLDFGGGLVRTLGMHRDGDDWSIRLHPGLPCRRYRFRVDGRVVSPALGTNTRTTGDAWFEIRTAA